MAARGSIAKTNITKEILDKFEGAFIAFDGKTIRIPFSEEGEVVEIKVTLTAAKDIEGGNAITSDSKDFSAIAEVTPEISEPTQEEKDKVNTLLKALNF